MPFVFEERGKENIVPVRLLSRDACVIGNALILYTLPCCGIDAKSNQRKNSRDIYSLAFTALFDT